MGLSITGYIDLSLTQHQFRDVIEKEVNGELSCIGSNKTNGKNPKINGISRKSRHVVIDSIGSLVLEWNCSHAAEVLSTCYSSFENIKLKDLGNTFIDLFKSLHRLMIFGKSFLSHFLK